MSAKSVLIIAMLCAALLGVSPVRAQQSAPPNPLDIVPEKMPFDIPYGTPISLERAEVAIAATVAEAKKRDWKWCVAIVDSGGNLVAFQRMDGTQLTCGILINHIPKKRITRPCKMPSLRRIEKGVA